MTDNVGVPGSVWEVDAVESANGFPERRKVVRPKWGGHHGQRVKGDIRWDDRLGGYFVTFSFLLGYATTQRKGETYSKWRLAMGEYREHDRAVQEKQRLENFRSAKRVL